MKRIALAAAATLTVAAMFLIWPTPNHAQIPPTNQLVAESAPRSGTTGGTHLRRFRP